MTVGFRIAPLAPPVDPALVEAFRAIPASIVSDCMSRMSASGADIRPRHAGGAMAGTALTVLTRPGDNLMLHKAIDMARPGDVIVVDGGGDLTNALMGEIMLTLAARRGVAGFVIDGAIRDLDAIAAQRLPVYARGITHRGPYKEGPGEINTVIQAGGMVVHPGDLVVGDGDGVIALRPAEAPAILAAALATVAKEEAMLAAIAAGTLDRAWVDETLKARGCAV
ncbi:RraA family protein [Phreatobacter sp.]|uniref:RraA family protein n=1 Tax=Phreatobacter sp. TaxID=1966341 RepID=UPI003F6FF75E